MEKERIDISHIESSFERTMLYYLGHIHEVEYVHDKQAVVYFLERYITELDSNVKRELLENPERLIDIIEESDTGKYPDSNMTYKPNASIYNVCGVMMDCDKLWLLIDEYLLNLSVKDYRKADLLVREIMEDILMIDGAITQFLFEMRKEKGVDMAAHYRILPEVTYYLKNHRQWLAVFDCSKQQKRKAVKETVYPFSVMLMGFDTVLVKKKIDIFKLCLANISILRSPEYTDAWKTLSFLFLESFRDILYKASIHKIYLQGGKLKGESESRGSNDGTTRIQCIFSLENEDIFVLRIDMPHKGEESLHMNLEEVCRRGITATAFPLKQTDTEYQLVIRKLEINEREELFFDLNERIWFKSNFEGKLSKLGLSEDKRKILEELFRKQSHKEITISGCEEQTVVLFFNEIATYMERMGATNMINKEFGKNTTEIWTTVNAIRGGFHKRKLIYEALNKEQQIQMTDFYTYIWDFYGEYGLKAQGYDRNSLENLTMDEVWKVLELYTVV